MMSEKDFKALEEIYKKEAVARKRYEQLRSRLIEINSVDTSSGYQLNSILCHCPNDIIEKTVEYLKTLIEDEMLKLNNECVKR